MPSYDPILVRWCNDELKLPIRISGSHGTEYSLANFVVIGHAATRVAEAAGAASALPGGSVAAFLSQLKQGDDTVTKIQNMNLLGPALAALNVRPARHLLEDVATEARGAGLQVLMMLKQRYDIARGIYQDYQKGKPPATERAYDHFTGTATFAGTRARREAEEAAKPYVQQLLEAGMSAKRAAQELHLKMFEDKKIALDRAIDAQAEQDRTARYGAAHGLTLTHRELKADRKEWLRQAQEAEQALHEIELDRMQDRERIDLAYELTALERQRIEAKNALLKSRREALCEEGIAGQEARMKALGIDPFTGSVEQVAGVRQNAIGASAAPGTAVRRPAVGGVSSASIASLAAKPIEQVATSVLQATLPALDTVTQQGSIARLQGAGGTAPLHVTLDSSLRALSLGTGHEAPQEYMERVVASLAASFKPQEAAQYEQDVRKRILLNREGRRFRATSGRLLRMTQAEHAQEVKLQDREQAAVDRYRQQARVEREAAEKLASDRAAKAQRAASDLAHAQELESQLEDRFQAHMSTHRDWAEEERRARLDAHRPAAEARALKKQQSLSAARAELSSWIQSDVVELLVDVCIAAVDTAQQALSEGREAQGSAGRLYPDEWRGIKNAFVDGSIAAPRLAATRAAARASVLAAPRPDWLPELSTAPLGLSPWGIMHGDRISGSTARIQVGSAALAVGEESLPRPQCLGSASPFDLRALDSDPDSITTAYLNACDFEDYRQGRGAWVGTTKAQSLPSPLLSAHSPARGRTRSSSRSPPPSPLAADITSESVEGNKPTTEKIDDRPTLLPATPSWQIVSPGADVSMLAQALLQAEATIADPSFLGPPLHLPHPTVLALQMAATEDTQPQDMVKAAVSLQAVGERLSARLSLILVRPQDVLLHATAVFDEECAKARESAAARGMKVNVFPDTESLTSGSLRALLAAWRAIGCHTLPGPAQWAFGSAAEEESIREALFELGATFALYHARLYTALFGPDAAVRSDGSACYSVELARLAAALAAVQAEGSQVQEAVQALVNARKDVKAAEAAAAAGPVEPAKGGKAAAAKPAEPKGAAAAGKDAKAGATGKGGKDAPPETASEPKPYDALLLTRIMATPLYCKALAFLVAQAQACVTRSRQSGGATQGGLCLLGLPSLPQHIVTLEFALGGELVFSPASSTDSPSTTPPPTSRPPSATAAKAGGKAAAVQPAPEPVVTFPPGKTRSPHVPADWGGTLERLLAALDAGSWSVPPVGPAAQAAWRNAVKEEQERLAAEAAQKAADEAAAAAAVKAGDKGKPKPAGKAGAAAAPAAPRAGPGPQPVQSSVIEAVLMVDTATLAAWHTTEQSCAIDVFTGLLAPSSSAATPLPEAVFAAPPMPDSGRPDGKGKAGGKPAPAAAKGKAAEPPPTDDPSPMVSSVNLTGKRLEQVVCSADEAMLSKVVLAYGWNAPARTWASNVAAIGTVHAVRNPEMPVPSLVQLTGVLEMYSEHLLARSHEGCPYARPVLEEEGTSSPALALLLTAAARGVLPDTGKLHACTDTLAACAAAYRDTVSHAMHALRALQAAARAHTRRVGRAFVRLLRGQEDAGLPMELRPDYPISHSTVSSIERDLLNWRVRAVESQSRTQAGGKKGGASQRVNETMKGTARRGTVQQNEEEAGIIITDAGFTNSALLSLAKEVSTLQAGGGQASASSTRAGGTQPDAAQVEELCLKASAAGSALWACIESTKESAKALLSALAEDGWSEDLSTCLHAICALLVHAELKAAQDALAYAVCAEGSLSMDVLRGYVALLQAVPVTVSGNAEGSCADLGPITVEVEGQGQEQADSQAGEDVVSQSLDIPHHAQAVLTGHRHEGYGPTATWALEQARSMTGKGSGNGAAKVVQGAWERILRALTTCAKMTSASLKSHSDMLDWCDAALSAWVKSRNTCIMATVKGIQAALRALLDPEGYRVAVAVADRRARLGQEGHDTVRMLANTPLGDTVASLPHTPVPLSRTGGDTVPRGTARAVIASRRKAGGSDETWDGLSSSELAADVPLPRITALSFIVAVLDGIPPSFGEMACSDAEGGCALWPGPVLHSLQQHSGAAQVIAPLDLDGVALAGNVQAAKEAASYALTLLHQSFSAPPPAPGPGDALSRQGVRSVTFNATHVRKEESGREATASGEAAHALVRAVGLLEGLPTPFALDARALLPLIQSLLRVIEEDEEGGAEGEVGFRPYLTNIRASTGSHSPATGTTSDRIDGLEDDGLGLVSAAKVLLACMRDAQSEPAQQGGSSTVSIPSVWLSAPASALLHLTRSFVSVDVETGRARWDVSAVRRLAWAAVHSRCKTLPTLQQILLQRRNLGLADKDRDGYVTLQEWRGACLWYETTPSRAVGAVADRNREALLALRSRMPDSQNALDLPRKLKIAQPVLAGRVAPEAAHMQGGERDLHVALRHTMVATSAGARQGEADAIRDVLWELYSSTTFKDEEQAVEFATGLSSDSLGDHAGGQAPLDARSLGASTKYSSLGSSFGVKKRKGGSAAEADAGLLDYMQLVIDLCSDPLTLAQGTGPTSIPVPHGLPLALLSYVGAPCGADAVLAGHALNTATCLPGAKHLTAGTRSAGSLLSGQRSEASLSRRHSHGSSEALSVESLHPGAVSPTGAAAGLGAGRYSAVPRLPGVVKAWLVQADAEAYQWIYEATPSLPNARERAQGIQEPRAPVHVVQKAVDLLSGCAVCVDDALAVSLGSDWAGDVLRRVNLGGLADMLPQGERITLAVVLGLIDEARQGLAKGMAPGGLGLAPGEVMVASHEAARDPRHRSAARDVCAT